MELVIPHAGQCLSETRLCGPERVKVKLEMSLLNFIKWKSIVCNPFHRSKTQEKFYPYHAYINVGDLIRRCSIEKVYLRHKAPFKDTID